MDNLERTLKEMGATTNSVRTFPYFGKFQKYVAQQHHIVEENDENKF